MADEDGDALACVEDIGSALEVGEVGDDARDGIADAGVEGVVELFGFVDGGEFLNIFGEDDAGDGFLIDGGADGAVDGVLGGVGRADLSDVFGGDVFEEAEEIDFLLVGTAEDGGGGLSDDGDDGLVVHFGVVEAVEEVDGTGAGGGHADGDVAGELGVSAGHEGGEFLVACLDETGFVAGALRAPMRPLMPSPG